MASIFQPTKPTWYLFVTVIAVVAIIVTWLSRDFLQRTLGQTPFAILLGTEFIAALVGVYFHFSYFWNAGPAGKAVVGYELFRDALTMLFGR